MRGTGAYQMMRVQPLVFSGSGITVGPGAVATPPSASSQADFLISMTESAVGAAEIVLSVRFDIRSISGIYRAQFKSSYDNEVLKLK